MFKFSKTNPCRQNNTFLKFFKNPIFIYSKVRISILGKIFKWIFKGNKINLNLNHSHPTQLFFKTNQIVLNRGKYDKLYIYTKPINKSRLLNIFNQTRPLNIFTTRGLGTNQPFSKKKGKISTYM